MAYEAGPPRTHKPAEFGYNEATSGPATAAGPDEDRLVRAKTIQTTNHERRFAGNG